MIIPDNSYLQTVTCMLVKTVFHCSRFAHAGEMTDFNLMKNQSRGHAKKVKLTVVQLPTDRKLSD